MEKGGNEGVLKECESIRVARDTVGEVCGRHRAGVECEAT